MDLVYRSSYLVQKRCGYAIEEILIVWIQGEKTNVLTRDIFSMGWLVLKFAWWLRVRLQYPKDV